MTINKKRGGGHNEAADPTKNKFTFFQSLRLDAFAMPIWIAEVEIITELLSLKI